MNRLIFASILILGIAGSAIAGTVSAPEIDASTGIAALTLVSGGILVLKSRRAKK